MPMIDLAASFGESFALPPAGVPLATLATLQVDGRGLHARHGTARGDELLLDVVSTGYVACGAHAGDALVMGRTVRLLAERGIAIGAHVSYPDVFGFGQLPLDLPDREFEDMLLAQVAALAALAGRAGSRVRSLRCHGALAFDVSYDERTAQVAARTVYRFDPTIALVCMAASPGARVVRDCGLPVVEEACVDRGYDRSGRIKALHADAALAAAQFVDIATRGCVQTIEGETIGLRAGSIYLHGDTPHAGAIAAAVAEAVGTQGITVRAPA